MRYLFGEWDNLRERLNKKLLFIFLDFDGTLAPIADTPEKAVISRQTKRLLNKLSNGANVKIAIISGRSLEDIKGKVGLHNIIYSGNHGLEIEGPKIKFTPLISSGYKLAIKTIKNILQKKLLSVKGVLLEDKGFSLSLHYRLVDEKQVPLVKTVFHETVIRYLGGGRIRIKAGKKVLEVRPPLEWDKGKVVLWLLARQKFSRPKAKVLPVYIGDDLTDEDAFKVLEHAGVTIFVGRPDKPSRAHYYLENTNEVAKLLEKILEIQNNGNVRGGN